MGWQLNQATVVYRVSFQNGKNDLAGMAIQRGDTVQRLWAAYDGTALVPMWTMRTLLVATDSLCAQAQIPPPLRFYSAILRARACRRSVANDAASPAGRPSVRANSQKGGLMTAANGQIWSREPSQEKRALLRTVDATG
jgi:hypothetical protein